jgi:hypothetical protein
VRDVVARIRCALQQRRLAWALRGGWEEEEDEDDFEDGGAVDLFANSLFQQCPKDLGVSVYQYSMYSIDM